MTPDEVKQSVTGWSSAEAGLELLGERSEPGADFALSIRSTASQAAPVEMQVLQVQGSDRITIKHTASLASGSDAQAQSILDSRPGWVAGTVERGWSGTSVTVEARVYHDGLTKNSFVQAASEVARTAHLLGNVATAAAGAAAAAGSAGTPQSTAQPSSIPQPVSTPQAMPAPSFTPQPQPQPQPQPVPQQPSWVPTHSVPPQGLRAWASPDPSGPVVATLAPGLPIQVSEVRGAWARVICSNGWTGWIDGRIIGVAA